jgi:hypothetical protein
MENYIRQKLTLNVFLLVSFAVISFPILFNIQYLLFGEKVDGVMIDVQSFSGRRSSYDVSLIKYKVGNENYSCYGPKNIIFEEGERVELYYLTSNPKDATLADPFYFYFASSGLNVLCTIFLIFWIATFFSFGIRYKP